MRLRSLLMVALEQLIDHRGLTQGEAAKLLGVTQPRISDLKRGKINLFAIDSLVTMATQAGLRVELDITEPA